MKYLRYHNIKAGKTGRGGDKELRQDVDFTFLFRRFTRSTILRCSSVSLTSSPNSGADNFAFISVSDESSSEGSSNTFRLRGESLGVCSKRAGAEAAILLDFGVRFFGLGLGDALTSDAGRPYVAKDLRSAVNNTFCASGSLGQLSHINLLYGSHLLSAPNQHNRPIFP